MNILQNRKVWLGTAVILIVACGLVAGNQVMSQEETQDGPDYIADTPVMFVQYPAGLKTGLNRLMLQNNLGAEEISKIDFSLPGDPGFGDNPQLEIFNKSGGGITPPLSKEIEKYSGSSRYTFTLGNKALNIKTDLTELMIIVPQMDQEFCNQYHQKVGRSEIPILDSDPNQSDYREELNEESVVTLPSEYGCVKGKTGLFWYFTLYAR